MNIEEFITLAKKKKINQLQIVEFQKNSLEVKYLNDCQKKYEQSNNISYEVKAKIAEKYVKTTCDYLEEEILDLLLLKSKNIESNYEDYFIESNEKTKLEQAEEIEIEDLKQLQITEQLKKKYPKVTDIEIIYEVENSSKHIINTNGLDISTAKTRKLFYVEVSVKEKKKIVTNNDTVYKTKERINFKEVMEQTIQDALKLTKERKLKTGEYTIILSPTFLSKMLKEAVPLFSKEEIRKKLSCLIEKENKKIFSEKLTIIEDPTNPSYPAYTQFDDEGTKTSYKELIKKGVLKTYLYNNREALLEKKASTGNGYGNISVANLYIKPGKHKKEELIQKQKNALYITKYQETGGITLNPTTGGISVQIYGYIIENGKITSAFEPCILTTSIFALFTNIVEIANNLEFKSAITGSPTISVEKMSISSN